jgi:hypothetical protein
MWYGDGLDTRNLGLLIDKKDTGKKVDVTLSPVFRLDAMAKDSKDAVKVSKKLFPDLQKGFEFQLNQLTAKGTAIDRAEGGAEEKAAAKNLVNLDLGRIREQLDKVNKAAALRERAHGTAVVHVRISYDTGFGKVVLAQTKGAPPPEPLGRKAAAKEKEQK